MIQILDDFLGFTTEALNPNHEIGIQQKLHWKMVHFGHRSYLQKLKEMVPKVGFKNASQKNLGYVSQNLWQTGFVIRI